MQTRFFCVMALVIHNHFQLFTTWINDSYEKNIFIF